MTAADGTLYAKGTAIPQRADFNTLDNPFFWTAHEAADAWVDEPAAGLHFVVFNPTSDDFRRTRLAMDGVMPDGTRLEFEPGEHGERVQLDPRDHASPELPGAAARAPLVPALRAPRLTRVRASELGLLPARASTILPLRRAQAHARCLCRVIDQPRED